MAYTRVETPTRASIYDDPRITQEVIDQQRVNRAEWVAQLRSGKYAQTKDYLRADNAYCCLGVLCDIINPGGWELQPVEEVRAYSFEDAGRMTPGRHNGFSFGLRSSRGSFEVTKELLEKFPKIATILDGSAAPIERHIGLTDLNDHGFSFQEIADVIEFGPKGLLYQLHDSYYI